ncbi:metallophosphoesterase [uncultured Corynebacterium sp.]|uniref:metallophosphoesterase family protein n=1 Tax=uncultured Corynebacterium sp. TaxID=159447 RepID=UPI00259A80E1|nr:metallophosphoesterase [uncultured Corynebacterium sp.]
MTWSAPEDLLVIADIHLGRAQNGEKKVGPGLGWALGAVERGAAAGCGHLVVLGDVIDKKRYTAETYGEVARLFERAGELFGTVLFVAGNHDTAHDLRGVIPAGVAAASTQPATYRAGGWALHTAAVAVDRDPRELAGDFPAPAPGWPNLGLLHTGLTGEWTSPCLPATPEQLLARGYDAWVLAHVHRPLTISEDPFVGYVGMGRALRLSAREAGGAGAAVRARPLDEPA